MPRKIPHIACHSASFACAIVVVLLIDQTMLAQEPSEQAIPITWTEHVLPILEDSCFDCHTGPAAEGSLDLEAYRSIEDVVADKRAWRNIATRVRDHQMPPEDAGGMTDADRRTLLGWVDDSLPFVPCGHTHHAGPVTIRRLTRYEYINTIRELLKLDYSFEGGFPVDEVGYGFDNIGDVLSVSPLLLEKYLAAAEAVSDAVVYDPAKKQLETTIEASEFSKIPGSALREDSFYLSTNGTTTCKVNAPVAGKYRVVIDAFGTRAGDELPKLAFSANGKVGKNFLVKAKRRDKGRDKDKLLELTVPLKEGGNQLGVSFTNDYYDPDFPNISRRDRNLAIRRIKISGPLDAPRPSQAQRAFLFVTPGEGQRPRDCAEKIINLHGSRAFRRRVYASERERLLALFDLGIENGESFEGAMQLVMQAMLVSPHFLYKVEAPAPKDGSPRPLSDFELATGLSYFLWSSMPDEALFRIASAGQLREEGRLESEVQRMLKDPQASALIENFAMQWFQLRGLEQADPDPDLFPGFTKHLRASMIRETQLLFTDIIRNDLPVTTLLTADYTYVNKTLARHYGWPTQGLREREFSRVSLAGKKRGGLLSHASFLTLTSNATRTSPVKRGKWVLENLLAEPPPPALPDVPQLDSQAELKGSLRERMEQHRTDPNCASCHYKMDSLGFALENFDAYGRFRLEDEEGLPVDASGKLANGDQFSSVKELQSLIATKQRRQFIRCIVEKIFIYALGRGPINSDECLIEGIARDAYENDYCFSDIINAIVTSEAFGARSRSGPAR
ncbi:MAG: DUF1592 domain-containing protein [Pirellulaceae bacterium]|nr:DUF1592 domain-containing protein [Pirellulaceae bacterium]